MVQWLPRARIFWRGAVQFPDLHCATGSEYFATCFAEHIPEDVDLVTVELGEFSDSRSTLIPLTLHYSAINDVRHVNSQVEYEMLIRGLLDLPNKPAIINMQYVSCLARKEPMLIPLAALLDSCSTPSVKVEIR